MLSFKDIKQNYPVFILDKQEMAFIQGKVTSVSFPHYDANVGQMPGSSTQMVVDVTVEANGKTATYVIPESASITKAGNVVLATERESLVHEIEALKVSSEQVIASVDYHKKVVEKSSELLKELNPVYREKEESEKRFKAIEGSVAEMGARVSELKTILTDFVKEFKS